MERYRGKTGDDITLDPDGDIVLYADAQATSAALQADNRTYINERHDNMKQIEQLQADLAERTAELEAAKASQAIDLKNNNAYREQVATLQAELERVRGLVKTYAAAKIDFDDKRLQEDHHAWRERYNKLVEAENALLQHRQGVEG